MQLVRHDFPTKGAISIYTKSLPTHFECPLPQKSWPVRAHIFIAAFIFIPKLDVQTGREHTDFFMVAQSDIAGWVPKFAVNAFAHKMPRKTFGEFEKAAQKLDTKREAELKVESLEETKE